MPSFRHVLADNHWEIQCPACQQFVPASRAVFAGELALPAHVRWAPSWSHRITEQWPAVYRRRWLIRLVIAVERIVRTVMHRWEPRCAYQEAHAWSQYWPSCGLSPGGPL